MNYSNILWKGTCIWIQIDKKNLTLVMLGYKLDICYSVEYFSTLTRYH